LQRWNVNINNFAEEHLPCTWVGVSSSRKGCRGTGISSSWQDPPGRIATVWVITKGVGEEKVEEEEEEGGCPSLPRL